MLQKEVTVKLKTLSEIIDRQENLPIFGTKFRIQTELGHRLATLRKPKRPDLCLIADIGDPITRHMVIDPVTTKIFL